MKENYNKILTPEMKAKLRKIKHLALDMDGTIYLGSKLFPFTIDFLDRMKAAGIGYSFLTNNPTKSVADYLAKLEGMGIHATEDNMYTTSLAAIDYIKKTWPAARRLFMLGTPSMVSQFEKAGFEAFRYHPGLSPPVPGRLVGLAGHSLRSHQPRPRMSHRSARYPGRLRLAPEMHRTRHRAAAGHRPRETRPDHAGRHHGPPRPAAG